MVFAAYHGNVDVIKVLHELLGAEAVNTPDKTLGQTPIFGAVQGCQSAAVRVLCELGADVNVKDKKGCTQVLFAAQKGFVELIRVFVEFGADVNAQNNEGFTSVLLAAHYGHDGRQLSNLKANGGNPQQASPVISDTPQPPRD